MIRPNGIVCGDACAALSSMSAASVDMVYCDPPFGNGQVWSGKAGSFDDRWAHRQSDGLEILRAHCAWGAEIIDAAPMAKPLRAYLAWVAPLLLGIRRVLKQTGTLWLHFDDTAGAYLRILCDAVFGQDNAVGLVIWQRSDSHSNARSFGRVHDTIACYARSPAARWRLWRCKGEFTFGDPISGNVEISGFADDRLNASSAERVGYPTQKPLSLLKRLILNASLPGALVVDPTCGSGTTLVAARGLGRRYIGIDISADAVAASRLRLGVAVQADLFAAVS